MRIIFSYFFSFYIAISQVDSIQVLVALSNPELKIRQFEVDFFKNIIFLHNKNHDVPIKLIYHRIMFEIDVYNFVETHKNKNFVCGLIGATIIPVHKRRDYSNPYMPVTNVLIQRKGYKSYSNKKSKIGYIDTPYYQPYKVRNSFCRYSNK